ncbi:MAG: Ig-like domain-containing protein [Bacteroidota bacterium]
MENVFRLLLTGRKAQLRGHKNNFTQHMLCGLLFLISLSAQAQLQILADRATAQYAINETAQFVVSSNIPGSANYTISYDRFTPPIATGTVNLVPGHEVSIPFSLSEPGLVQCSVQQNGQFANAAAVFAPYQIQPLETVPSDFDQFWNQAKTELAAVPVDPQVTWISTNAYSTTYRVNLATVSSRRVYGYIVIPNGAGPFPAILSLPSFGSQPNVVQPDITLAEQGGAISMSISIHNSEPDQFDPNAYMPDEITDPNQLYSKLAVLAGIRAIDYLYTRNDFNGSELAVNGVSQGGGLAIMLAGLDTRVKLLVYSNPTHCEHAGLKYGKASGFPYYLDRSQTQNGDPTHFEATLQSVKYFEASTFAQGYSGPSLGIVSYEDDVCPAAATFTAYNQLEGQRILLHARELAHSHPGAYWEGRFDFYRQHFPSMKSPPWPWPASTTGYTIDAGADQMAMTGQAISLNAQTQNNDQLINLTEVQWELVEGPGNVLFSNPNAYSTNATFSQAGRYHLRFRADDRDLLSSQQRFYTLADDLWVDVDGIDNQAPVVNLNTPLTTVNGPFQVTVTFSEDINGLNASDFVLTNATTGALSGNGAVYTMTIQPAAPGLITLQLPNNRVTDLAGNPNTASNILNIQYQQVDNIPPTVLLNTPSTIVSSAFPVNISFSENVNNFSLADIQVTNGNAANLIGSGSNYSFTVNPIAQGAISIQIPANQLTDLAGNGNLASNALEVQYTPVDNTPPSILLNSSSTQVNGPFSIEIIASEAIIGLEIGDLLLTNATASALNANGNSYTLSINPISEGNVSIQIPANRLTDLAGNGNLASNILNVQYNPLDNTPPTVILSSASAQVSGAFSVDINFSEAVMGFALEDVVVVNGTAISLNGSGTNYSVGISPTAEGTVTIYILASQLTDLAGNGNLGSNWLNIQYLPLDLTPPVVTLSTSSTQVDGPFNITINFSESITGFSIEDIMIDNGTGLALNGNGITYTLGVDPISEGQVTMYINANQLIDLAGNGNVGSNWLTVQYTPLDNIPPSINLSTNAAIVTGAFTVTITSNETIQGFTLSDLIVENGQVNSLSGSGSDFSVVVQPQVEGQVSIWMPANQVQDQLGNGNLASNVLQVAYQIPDVIPPGINLSTNNSMVEGPFEVDILFSEVVEGLTIDDFVVSNGILDNLTGSNSSYRIRVSPLAIGTVEIQLPANQVQDISGNGNLASNTLTVEYIEPDQIPPSIELSTALLDVENAFEIDIRFSEPVVGFLLSDLTVGNGSASNLTGSDLSYRCTISPENPGLIRINLNAGLLQDLAGNQNLASNTLEVIYRPEREIILTLTGTLSMRQVQLDWLTNTDDQNAFFILERMVNGQSFETLDQVESQDSTTSLNSYQLFDPRPITGINEYRIKQVGLDGSFRYSNTVAIPIDYDTEALVLYPVPTTQELFIDVGAFVGKPGTIELFDSLGRPVLNDRYEELPKQAISYDLSQLGNGVYQIRFTIKGTKRFSRQFILAR